MISFAMTLNLKDDPETIHRYVECHRQVWPEVQASLRSIGLQNMRIFLKGRRLFMYGEAMDGFEPSRDFASYLRDDKTKEWDALMRTFQEPVPEAAAGEWWSPMEEVFALD